MNVNPNAYESDESNQTEKHHENDNAKQYADYLHIVSPKSMYNFRLSDYLLAITVPNTQPTARYYQINNCSNTELHVQKFISFQTRSICIFLDSNAEKNR